MKSKGLTLFLTWLMLCLPESVLVRLHFVQMKGNVCHGSRFILKISSGVREERVRSQGLLCPLPPSVLFPVVSHLPVATGKHGLVQWEKPLIGMLPKIKVPSTFIYFFLLDYEGEIPCFQGKITCQRSCKSHFGLCFALFHFGGFVREIIPWEM